MEGVGLEEDNGQVLAWDGASEKPGQGRKLSQLKEKAAREGERGGTGEKYR